MEKVNHASSESLAAIKDVIFSFKVRCRKMDLTEIKGCDLNQDSRKTEIVLARQLLMNFLKQYTLASLNWIGQESGGKDHATVLHAVKAINNYNSTNKLFKAEFDRVNKLVVEIIKGQAKQENTESMDKVVKKLEEKLELEEYKTRLDEAIIEAEASRGVFSHLVEKQKEQIKELQNEIEKLHIVNTRHINQIEKLNYEIEGYKGSVRLLKRKLEIANLPFLEQLAFS